MAVRTFFLSFFINDAKKNCCIWYKSSSSSSFWPFQLQLNIYLLCSLVNGTISDLLNGILYENINNCFTTSLAFFVSTFHNTKKNVLQFNLIILIRRESTTLGLPLIFLYKWKIPFTHHLCLIRYINGIFVHYC